MEVTLSDQYHFYLWQELQGTAHLAWNLGWVLPKNRGSKIRKIFLSAQQDNSRRCHLKAPLKGCFSSTWAALLIWGCLLHQMTSGFACLQLQSELFQGYPLLDAEALHWWLIYVSESGLDLKQNPLILHHCFTLALPPELIHGKWNHGSLVLSWQWDEAELLLPVRQGSPSSLLAAAREITVLGWRIPGWNPKPGLHTSSCHRQQPTSAAARRSTEHLPKSYQKQYLRVFLEISSMQTQHQWLSTDPCVYEKCPWEPICRTEINGRIWGPCAASPDSHCHPAMVSCVVRKKYFSPWGSRLFYASLLGITGRNGPGCSTSWLPREREKI